MKKKVMMIKRKMKGWNFKNKEMFLSFERIPVLEFSRKRGVTTDPLPLFTNRTENTKNLI